jgi:glycosyltransferase involved in cell wall biosynthesis
MKLSIYGAVNLLSYGLVTTNLVHALTKLGHEIQLFPINEHNIECEPKYQESIKQALQNAQYFDTEIPVVKIWHQWQHVIYPTGNYHVAFPIFELDALTEIEKRHLDIVDNIFVCSNWSKDVIDKHLEFNTGNVVPLGVDLDVFSPSVNPIKGKTIFLNIGKWEYRKGHQELIAAFSQAFGQNDRVELWMMTENPFLTPQERETWENLIKNSPLSSKIRLLPRLTTQNEVKYIIGQSHFGVFPSRAEGWGLPTLEMMACRVPSIVSNYGGFTEYCNEKNSLLIDFDGIEPANDGKWFKYGGVINSGNWGKFTQNTMNQLIARFREAHKMNLEQNDTLEGLKLECLETAKKFTWTNSAQILIKHLSRWV